MSLGGGRRARSPEPPASKPQRTPSDARVRALADAYLDGFFRSQSRRRDHVRHPRPAPRQAARQLPFEALKAWQAKEDGWLAQAKRIDPATIDSAPLRGTYAIVREALEGAIGARVCRSELWDVSQFVNGWQVQDGYLVTIQPVGSEEVRNEALARWSRLPKYIDTEIANLRAGLKAGYSAPKGNVRIVIDQMNSLIATPTADSPFDSPAVQDKTPEFVGMLSSQALRAARLVVDSGLHALGWTRQQAIDYMLAHTAEDEADVVSEIDRYIIYPGQATAYMLGKLQISRARDEAQRAMGQKFDIKRFHDRVLEDGAVPVSYLHAKIKAWAAK